MFVNVYKNPEVLFLVNWLFLLFGQKIEAFTLGCTMVMFIKPHEKVMYNTFESISFHGQGID